MTEREFSEETRRQAAVFDQIGRNYEAVYGENATQVAAVGWLIERLPAGSRVLDVGSGTGVPTASMLAAAGHQVVGVDISREMVAIARERVPAATFHQMDVMGLELGGEQFDAVTAFFALLMLRRSAIEASIARLASALRPGGLLVLAMIEFDADYIEVPFIGQSVHVSGYPRAELARVIEAAGLAVLDLKAQEFQAEGAPPETQLFFFCERSA